MEVYGTLTVVADSVKRMPKNRLLRSTTINNDSIILKFLNFPSVNNVTLLEYRVM